MQFRQRPQTTWPSPLTRSPTRKSLTFDPTSTTSPTNSWPITSGTGIVRWAHASHRWMCTSVPQIPVRLTRIRTSLIPISGSGTSSSQRPASARLLTSAFTSFCSGWVAGCREGCPGAESYARRREAAADPRSVLPERAVGAYTCVYESHTSGSLERRGEEVEELVESPGLPTGGDGQPHVAVEAGASVRPGGRAHDETGDGRAGGGFDRTRDLFGDRAPDDWGLSGVEREDVRDRAVARRRCRPVLERLGREGRSAAPGGLGGTRWWAPGGARGSGSVAAGSRRGRSRRVRKSFGAETDVALSTSSNA